MNTEMTIDNLLAYFQELHNHALELLPLDDDNALIQEHRTYLHWLNHNAYARFVTFEDNDRLQISTGVLAAETLAELNQLNDNASLHADALGYRMRTPQRVQLNFFRGYFA